MNSTISIVQSSKWSFSLEKRMLRGDLTDVYKYWTGVRKEDATTLLLMHSEWTRGNGHKVEYKKFCFNVKKKKLFYCNGEQTLEQFAERGWGVSVPEDIHDSTGHGPE